MLRVLLAGLVLLPLGAQAQMMYNGYDIGPDYGAMLRQQQAIQAQRNAEMQVQQDAIVRGAMQDPRCQAAYQQFLGRGGQMPYPNFAYECARTGRFTPEGMAYANRVEADNRARETARLQDLRRAEGQRNQAQQQLADGYHRNNGEFGNGLIGQGTYGNPLTGGPIVLQNTRPGMVTTDPQTGQRFTMDNLGNQYVLAPNGAWMPMTPIR